MDAMAAPPDPHSSRTEQAGMALKAAQAQVLALEKNRARPEEQDRARQCRSDLAQAWRREADAWAAAAPSERAAVTASKKAQAEFYIPSGGLVDP